MKPVLIIIFGLASVFGGQNSFAQNPQDTILQSCEAYWPTVGKCPGYTFGYLKDVYDCDTSGLNSGSTLVTAGDVCNINYLEVDRAVETGGNGSGSGN